MCLSSLSRCRPTIRRSGVLISSAGRTCSSASSKWVSTKGSVAPSSTSGKDWHEADPALQVAHLQLQSHPHQNPLRALKTSSKEFFLDSLDLLCSNLERFS